MKRSSSALLALTLGAVIALASSPAALAAENAAQTIAAKTTTLTEPAATTSPATTSAVSRATSSNWTQGNTLPHGLQEAIKKRAERRTTLRWC